MFWLGRSFELSRVVCKVASWLRTSTQDARTKRQRGIPEPRVVIKRIEINGLRNLPICAITAIGTTYWIREPDQ